MKKIKAALTGALSLMLVLNSFSVVLAATDSTPNPNPPSNPTQEQAISASTDQGVLKVIETYPKAGDDDMLIEFPIGIQFDRTLNPTVNNNNLRLTESTGKTVPVHLKIAQDKLMIMPDESLSFDTSYTLTIDQGVVSDSTKSFANEPINLRFKTGKEFTRLAGTDRYNTSIKISQEGWDHSDVAVLATGEDFPDALGATPLAKMYNAPLLLTDPKNLLPETEAELARLGVSKVFIVGGTGAVSQAIEDKLTSLHLETKRLWGDDRYQTALAIANHLGKSEEIFLVTGENFPDALSIASYAANKKIPIILTGQSSLPAGVKDYISNNGVTKSYIIGGEGIISPQIESQLPNVQRIAGKDRYDTNLEVLMNFELYGTATFVATAENFPDALAGSAMAGTGPFAVILVSPNMSQEQMQILQYARDVFKNKYILGGESIVPQALLDKIFHG